MHALFITTPAPAEPLDATEGRDENDERTIDLQPGQITMLEPGEEVQTSAPADVGQTYEAFQYRTLLQVSAALGVPYAYLSNDMLKANYSNSRTWRCSNFVDGSKPISMPSWFGSCAGGFGLVGGIPR